MLTVTIVDPKWFSLKNKPVTYTRAFIELYNWRNHGQVYENIGIIKLKSICALTAKNFFHLGTHHIIEILLVLQSAYIILRDQHIDWD